ncbi:hypothetical protein [Haloferula rosea]|uniref:Uncharacterized protein n=1 Tax=Haloferula rosea TaxID=490093 RepID=A0A934R9N7_9BACT|nr:hypothetical protein [Haloferula rosea]MBK1825763.1 hypothetical protein [Haloferula rosea]
MKALFISLALIMSCHADERVKCADGRYSFEFPAKWVKAKSPTPKADFARESPDKGTIISINTDAIPEGRSPDLDAIAKSSAQAMAKAIGFKGEGTASPGKLDGCDARFVTLIPEEGQLGIVAVFIDGRKDLVRFQATIALPLDEKTKDACLAIVQSFRREDAKKEE